MLCFVCKTNHSNLEKLVRHFKCCHNLNSNSTFRCYECGQCFQNLSSFKRHMNRKHLVDEVLVNCTDKGNDDFTINMDIPVTSDNSLLSDSNCPRSVFVDNKTPGDKIDEEIQNEPEQFNFDSLHKKVENAALQFLLSLHNNDNFTRKDVLQIQNIANGYLLEPLLDMFMNFAKCNIQYQNPALYNEMSSLISNCRNPFKAFSSDYLFHKILTNKGCVNTLKEITINNEVRPVHRAGNLITQETKIKGIVMPLKFQFKAFFEKNKLLEPTLAYMKDLEVNNTFTNFMQGELWKNKIKLYPGKITIPFFLYIDDFEINNPLGSHSSKHSVCNIYYSFPCLPVQESKLENIFYAGVIKSNDLKTFGNENCFEYLIEVLKDLEINGILIESHDNKSANVHFILGLVIGDNLGLNSFLDFSKSFSSNYFCRLCRASKADTQKMSYENTELNRTVENYELDASNTNSMMGISKISLLNNIPSFHVVTNYYADVMHDLFEGICHYDLCHIIEYFITMKYFDLDGLNDRKQNFEYGPIDINTICGKIEPHHLKKRKLKMSAREMMTFILYFPIMIGDLVPSDDTVWRFLVNFVEIIDILLCFEIDVPNILLLENKIKDHNRDYTALFNDTLKPKHHLLTHYPKIIRQSGPLRKLWCFKFESKHRQFKIYSHCITSRKNICLTLAKKYELKFAFQIMNTKNFFSLKGLICDENFRVQSNYQNIIRHKLNFFEGFIEFYSRIYYQGIEYRCHYYLPVYNNDILLYVILDIVILEKKPPIFFCQKLLNVRYDPHLLAYEIDPTNLGEFSLIFTEKILGPPITLIKTARGKNMLRIKEYYKNI
ncbi:uncharacterized protein LOC115883721 isoform X1 [Sitophilus oryzae]|uniref:Uncharacterized protein LOC115883721 isoform X1 n=1 Tax=Sitophilus oryzae TaxID=7048 RepID=A0A6J2Y4S2_SITOR|nr:uncharacterized protein LOC115883721 isoform X1 [Sitophilus oryzae]